VTSVGHVQELVVLKVYVRLALSIGEYLIITTPDPPLPPLPPLVPADPAPPPDPATPEFPLTSPVDASPSAPPPFCEGVAVPPPRPTGLPAAHPPPPPPA
jgi:hypothetical protein